MASKYHQGGEDTAGKQYHLRDDHKTRRGTIIDADDQRLSKEWRRLIRDTQPITGLCQ